MRIVINKGVLISVPHDSRQQESRGRT